MHIGLSIPLLGIPLLGPQFFGIPLLAIDIRKNTVWEIERTVEWEWVEPYPSDERDQNNASSPENSR
ncbi:MAG TPA: hypothetical protein VF510_05365 [Ktedonobacterales bacterium]